MAPQIEHNEKALGETNTARCL